VALEVGRGRGGLTVAAEYGGEVGLFSGGPVVGTPGGSVPAAGSMMKGEVREG
jgi:hypothetical protein